MPGGSKMKLLVFNIGYGKGWTDQLKYLQNRNVMSKIVKFVEKISPDVAGLIEINLEKQVNLFKFKTFEASCKYHSIFHKLPYIGKFGNAVFSKKKLKIRKRFLSVGGKRLVLDCELPKARLLLVHLSLNQRIRAKQIAELAKMATEKTIIAGDFNINSIDELQPILQKGFQRLIINSTFPSWNPKKSYDQVLVKGVRAKAKVLKTKLSDHLPILVEIK